MLSRQVAIVGVHVDAANAFKSMLELLNGRSSCRWNLVESADDASVVVTSGSSDMPNWSRQGKRIVAIVETFDVRPETPYVLNHPFRVMQVLSILDEIAGEFAPQVERHASHAPLPDAMQWEFASSVRELQSSAARASCYHTQTREGSDIIVAGDLHSYACEPAVLEKIRAGGLMLAPLTVATVQKLSLRYERRPILELLWHNAYNASRKLAPWLDAGAFYRISRWPDFGVIPPTRARLQLIAAMSMRACSRNDLASTVESPLIEIDRLLNALSLCGLLSVNDTPHAPSQNTSAQPSSQPHWLIRSLISGLRKRLHLAA